MDRYIANLFCGRKYIGNGLFNTFDACIAFLNNDGFADRVEILDTEKDMWYKVTVKSQKE